VHVASLGRDPQGCGGADRARRPQEGAAAADTADTYRDRRRDRLAGAVRTADVQCEVIDASLSTSFQIIGATLFVSGSVLNAGAVAASGRRP
jgi:hypothetical protein